LKNKIVIAGGGGHAKVVISIIRKLEQFEILGYTDRNNNGSILGAPYLGNDDSLHRIIVDQPGCSAAIGVGMISVNNEREKIFNNLKEMGFKLPPIISPYSVINEEVGIDEGSVVMDGVVVNTGTKVGKCCILNTNSTIEHDCEISDFTHISSGAVLGGGVKIGKHCLIGAGATVRHYVSVADFCLIGAGASIVKNCDSSGIYIGVPGRIRL
jgi:sugar O-acyltransferase (sialic acid O-acetyltransferase NeuD family)